MDAKTIRYSINRLICAPVIYGGDFLHRAAILHRALAHLPRLEELRRMAKTRGVFQFSVSAQQSTCTHLGVVDDFAPPSHDVT